MDFTPSILWTEYLNSMLKSYKNSEIKSYFYPNQEAYELKIEKWLVYNAKYKGKIKRKLSYKEFLRESISCNKHIN